MVDKNRNFKVCILLKLLSGPFEDFPKIVVNKRLELVLLCASNEFEPVISIDETEEPKNRKN